MRIAWKTDVPDTSEAPLVGVTTLPEEEPADPFAAFPTEAEMEQATSGEVAIEPPTAAKSPALFQWPVERWLLVAALVVAVAEAGVLVWAFAQRPAAAPTEGRLRVATEARGAEVLVDGVIKGPAPFELPLEAGRHTVEVRAGENVRRFAVDIRAGLESHHHVDLPAVAAAPSDVAATSGSSAGIEITSDPAGARVSIDGTARGVTPLQLANLSPGMHTIVLSDGGGSVTRRVRLEAARTASLVVSMPRESPMASGWVRLQLPVVAQIYQGTDLLGTTEIGRLMLPTGRHTLRLVNETLKFETQQTVEIGAGKTTTVNVPLPSGLLSINALPWAEVWVDGQAKGETPIGNLAIPIGTHEVVFRHPQLGEQRRSVTVTLGGVTRVGVDLKR